MMQKLRRAATRIKTSDTKAEGTGARTGSSRFGKPLIFGYLPEEGINILRVREETDVQGKSMRGLN